MKINKKVLLLILFGIILVCPGFVFAQNQITTIANNFKTMLFTVGTSIVIIGWVIAGILYLTSIGKPEKMQTATKALIAAVIGTALMVFAGAAVNIIQIIQNALLHGA
jgi:hypothetical protein